MPAILFANDASTTLAGAITSSATTVNLAAGTTTKFPSPSGGTYFIATFIDQATGLIKEIVHCTGISGDTCTIVRAQEGTTALGWNAGDIFANQWTAGSASAFIQTGTALLQANNLSDVQSAATSRTNLGLGTAAVEPTSAFDAAGTAASAAAAAQSAAIAAAEAASLQRANNLSDLTNPATARTNLGVYNVPTGTILAIAYFGNPTGTLTCDGTAYNRVTYAALFALIGTTWGSGDGSTTFNVPDFRGQFLRGFDEGKGVDPGRVFASYQADITVAHTHDINVSTGGQGAQGGGQTAEQVGTYTTSTNQNPAGGTETRPKNYAIIYAIKT